jgi:hypothetical protein
LLWFGSVISPKGPCVKGLALLGGGRNFKRWGLWEWGGYKERVKEAECSGDIIYSYLKMEK